MGHTMAANSGRRTFDLGELHQATVAGWQPATVVTTETGELARTRASLGSYS